MSGALNRKLLLKDIVIECAPDDVGSPALNGLALRITDLSEMDSSRLDLEKISETRWKYAGVIEISPFTIFLFIFVESECVENIAYAILTENDWGNVQDDSPSGNCLKRTFELMPGGKELKMSASLEVQIPTSDEVSQRISAGGCSTVPHTSCLSDDWATDTSDREDDQLSNRDDNTLRVDLHLHGHQSLETAAFLSVDDSGLGEFLGNNSVGDLERYNDVEQTDDNAILETREAITNALIAFATDANSVLLHHLGTECAHRFDHTGDLQDISEAIQHKRLVVQLALDGDTNLPLKLVNLGAVLLRRFERTQDLCDISEAIQSLRRAVQLTADGSAHLPLILSHLGTSLWNRSRCTGDMDDISNAIQSLQGAVQLTPDGHVDLPDRLSYLGTSLLGRFRRTGDLRDISNAIKNLQRAVQLTPEGHADLPDRLSNLGASFVCQYEHTRDLDDVSHAIYNLQRAVRLTPDRHVDLPDRFSNLGTSLSCRFQHTEDLDDISNAIQNHQRAVQLAQAGHPHLPLILSSLGTSFLGRFGCTGDLHDISNAIQNLQDAVQLTPEAHADLPDRLGNLGASFACQYEHTRDLDDVSNAIQSLQRAVQLTPEGHAGLPDRFSILGTSFSCQFQHTEDLNDISNAIKNHQRAVQLAPAGHPHLPLMLSNLGSAFTSRFERSRNLVDISNAIKSQMRVVQLTPDGHVDLPHRLSNLGTSFLYRFQHTGDLRDISNAVQNLQRAVQLTPDGHVDLPHRLGNLGTSLSHQFQYTGDLRDISNAIKNEQRAVQLTPDGHADLQIRLNNLGTSFMLRFQRTGGLDDICEAIQNHQCAVQFTPDGHADFPRNLLNLGNAFFKRFDRTGELDDICEAIQNQQRAVQLTPEGHAELPSRLTNLGNSLLQRFERAGNSSDMSEAIHSHQLAVQLTPDGHAQLPVMLTNLGNTLLRRFQLCTGDLDDISDSIRKYQLAVQLTPDGHADLQLRLCALGSSFMRRFETTEDPGDISNAIQNQQRGIQLTPDGHPQLQGRVSNRGIAFFNRFKHSGDLKDISQAIENQKRAIQLIPDGHVNLPDRLAALGNSFFELFIHTEDPESLLNAVSNYSLSATSPTGRPSMRLYSAKRWASLSRRSPSLSSQLLDAHACIIQLLSLVSGLENTVQHRHKSLIHSSQLSTAASAAALSLGRPDKALEWLVGGRCIVWNQINHLRTPVDDLRAHDRALAERLCTVARELENSGSRELGSEERSLSMDDKISMEEQAGRHVKLAREWDQLLATIRSVNGFEDFLQPRKCADIMGKLPDDGVIVITSVHNDRCDALALKAGADEPVHVPLPRFSYQEAKHLSKGLRRYLRDHGAMSRVGIPLEESDSANALPDLPEILKVLWSDVVKPILEALRVAFSVTNFELNSPVQLPRIWWCPTGPLAFLPIHAAGIYIQGRSVPRECLSDFAVSSYIPTVNALLRTSDSDSVQERGDSPTQLLIVSQPNTPGQTPIPYAASEAMKISMQLEKRQISSITLNDEMGTVECVSDAMDTISCIHLACHGCQHNTSPLNSSIFLYDGSIKLADIMKKNLTNADFAFLSACQTSTGDENLPEEVVHLAAGMLAAGYRSVVGTMWSIFDEHGPDLAETFYKRLLETNEGSKIDSTGAARALHHATQQLREKISDSPESLLAWVPYIHIGI